MQTALIYSFMEHIRVEPSSRIVLLRQEEVLRWVIGDTSFLAPPPEETHRTADQKRKWFMEAENQWGRDVMKIRRPDLTMDKQWTNRFGEYLCEELSLLQGMKYTKPVKKNHHQPDLEVDDAIWEAKAGTYFTSGTAHEKILGVPQKYRNVFDLYNKPLKIICIGGAEKRCREEYGNLPGEKFDAKARRLAEFYKDELHVEYIGASDIIRNIVEKNTPNP